MAGEVDSQGSPDLNRQPRPIDVMVSRIQPRFSVVVTAITRHWHHDDIPHCRLCPVCTAGRYDSCTVTVAGDVADADLALFRRNGATTPPTATAAPHGIDGQARLRIY